MFSPHIISSNSSANKLRIQRDEIEEGKRFPLGRLPYRTLINLGSRTENCYEKVALIEKDGVILNHPDQIKNASDKVLCKQKMIGYGLPTPPFHLLTEDCKLKFPVVIKLRRGSGGRGMIFIENKEAYSREYEKISKEEKALYFVEEVFQDDLAKSYEFRVSVSPWLVHLKVDYPDRASIKSGEIVTMRKLMRQDAVNNNSFGRNIALGNSYFTKEFNRVISPSRNPQIANIDYAVGLALEAVNSCGLDFGAVDMIYDSESKYWTILEINTAPSLGDEEQNFTANRWKTALRNILEEKYNLK